MADGTRQTGFHLPALGRSRLRPGEIVVDLFAGGGGASEALRQALGRDPDIAINHDAAAIGMHAANHPYTRHLQEDVWHADPRRLVAGRPVGWLHASPDCCHFSQAKGGQPRSKAIRSLAWVVLRWAGTLARDGVAPRILSLENVKQLLGWGPLVAKRDPATGRVVTLDMVTGPDGRRIHRVAAPGERVPVQRQFLVPDKRHQGRTWRHFVAALRCLGYTVEWRKIRACDHGAGTTRERLFVIGRRDGQQIRWSEPSHGPDRAAPYVTAADCIDWSIPCPSIFTRKRPLADATLRRIARGIDRFVLRAPEPFIVQCANASADGLALTDRPLGVVTAWPRGGTHAVVAPTLVQASHGDGLPGGVQRWGAGAAETGAPVGTITASGGGGHALASATLVKFRGDSPGHPVTDPVPTVTSGAGAARPAGAAHAMGVLTAYLEQANGGPRNANLAGHGAGEPVSTITQAGSQQRLVTAHLATLRHHSTGAPVADPLATIAAQGGHHAVVECQLSPEHEEGALRVAAFLLRYHSTGGQWASLRDPMTAVTTKDRLALVTVLVRGVPHVIVDIGLRMLKPRELYAAQGFPSTYIIDRTADGRRLTNSEQVRMVGNSVSPPPLRALAEANLDTADERQAVAA